VSSLLTSDEGGNSVSHSIELCGGTHLRNTREALAFVLLGKFALSLPSAFLPTHPLSFIIMLSPVFVSASSFYSYYHYSFFYLLLFERFNCECCFYESTDYDTHLSFIYS
jgi:hypothetical protein